MISDKPPGSAVLVGIRLPGMTEEECESSLAELRRLVHTLGHRTIATLVQHRHDHHGATVIGEGKLAELAHLTGGKGVVASKVKRKVTRAQLRDKDEEPEEEPPAPVDEGPAERARIVVFDCELTPSQMQKLESATGAEVLDRNAVIIQIFSRHARTRAARLQVELAQLAYLAPRLRETAGGGERQGGGIGGKGAGETKLELDRRRIRDRMKELKDELAHVADEDARRRERRASERTVALVGYTNAGKSSLMRALTGSEVLVQDKLFATLDTTVRPLHPEAHPRVLVSDTVGFIQKLPHDLVASFKSTLEEALHASLLVYVVDASDPAFRHQLGVTREVLAEVGASALPGLVVLNKIDRLAPDVLAALTNEFPDAIRMSALARPDVAKLREKLVSFFETGMVDRDLFVPYTAQHAVGAIRAAVRVLGEEYGAEGVTLTVRGLPETLTNLSRRLGR
jgi:GTP-binding protein HflX